MAEVLSFFILVNLFHHAKSILKSANSLYFIADVMIRGKIGDKLGIILKTCIFSSIYEVFVVTCSSPSSSAYSGEDNPMSTERANKVFERTDKS